MESDVERQLGEKLEFRPGPLMTPPDEPARQVATVEFRDPAQHARFVEVLAVTQVAEKLSRELGVDYAEAVNITATVHLKLRGYDAVKELLDTRDAETSLLSVRRVRHALEKGHDQLPGESAYDRIERGEKPLR